MKILFVCLGNICRSPMAEGLLRKRAAERGIPLTVDSAATSRWEVGNPPYPGTQEVLRKAGVDFSMMRARQITEDDFYRFDYIIGMDQNNLQDLKAIAPKETKEKIFLYMSIVPGKEQTAIPDPWYTGDFQETYEMLTEGLDKWLDLFEKDAK